MLDIVKKWMACLYFHYELITCVYMLEPWERKLINGMVALILALVTFSSIVYLPKYTETLLELLTPVPDDSSELHVQRTSQKIISVS